MIETLVFHSGMLGVPGVSLSAVGALTSILDFCLVNGGTPVAVTSLTRSGSVATATLGGTNNFSIRDVIEISGADQPDYNSRFRVTGRTSSTINFTVPETFAATVTGSAVSAKLPSAGWTRSQADTNVIAYQAGPGVTNRWIQVEDNDPYSEGGSTSRLRMAVGWSDLNVASELGSPSRLRKTGPGWVLVADKRTCYIICGRETTIFFGAGKPFDPVDGHMWCLSRGTEATYENMAGHAYGYETGVFVPYYTGGAGNPLRVLRPRSQVGSEVSGGPLHMMLHGHMSSHPNLYLTQSLNFGVAAAAVPVVTIPIATQEPEGWVLRGLFPGALTSLVPVSVDPSTNVSWLDDIVVNGSTRRLIACRLGPGSAGTICFDVTDVWQ